jgi:hypothetical protein
MIQPRIACLMGTYGRRGFACEALACFLQQTAIEQATLLVYNQHPVPMSFDHPRVRVVNEVIPNVGLRQIKTRMIELTDPDIELIHFWDDDDLYLPWHLEDSLAHIGDNIAWQPARSRTWQSYTEFSLGGNTFEGSVTMRASFARNADMDFLPT